MVRVLTERQSPPAANQGGSNVDSLDPVMVPSTTDEPALNAHVVIVSTSDGKAHRRVYLGLPSAEKAPQRAEGRGYALTLHLCRLVPVLAAPEGVLPW